MILLYLLSRLNSNLLATVRKQYPEYPNGFYQLNQNNNPMYYPPAQTYPSGMYPSAYQNNLPGMYPYSRGASPTMNQGYPHGNVSENLS